MKKFKIALAAVLVAATSSAALAQGYYNPSQRSVRSQQNRDVRQQFLPPLQQRAVALPTQAQPAGPIWYNGSGPTSGGM